MKKNRNRNFTFRLDLIIIFIVILLGPAIGLLISKTDLLDKIELLKILKPEVAVHEQILLNPNHKIFFSSTKSTDLEVLLEQVGLDYSKVLNLENLSNLNLLSLPKDLSTIEPTSRRKKIFLSSILPLIVNSNLEILNHRKALCEAIKKNDYEKKQIIAKKYNIDLSTIERLMIDDTLIRHIDAIPISLALSQAAVESGWGTSRFALQGNALFGQWVWNESKGIKPKLASDKNAVVRKFETLGESVKAYLLNLNTHFAYSAMRAKRKRNCSQKKLISGFVLANWMGNYAITRDEYIKTLRLVIKTNKLEFLDDLI